MFFGQMYLGQMNLGQMNLGPNKLKFTKSSAFFIVFLIFLIHAEGLVNPKVLAKKTLN
jgi:hypothetical protein